MRTVELNADVGELPGAAGRAADRELLAIVTAANVACGAHAGDDETIAATLEACRELGVVAGAHPGYPDREGFGRRRGALSPDGVRAAVREQLVRFGEHAARADLPFGRVKAHGALYNEAAVDRTVADALLAAIADVVPGVQVLALAASPFVLWARGAGFAVLAEGFADRGYRSDRTLVPRGEPCALVDDPAAAASRAVSLALRGRIATDSGVETELTVDTLCVHGDSPGAVARARAVRSALEAAGVSLACA